MYFHFLQYLNPTLRPSQWLAPLNQLDDVRVKLIVELFSRVVIQKAGLEELSLKMKDNENKDFEDFVESELVEFFNQINDEDQGEEAFDKKCGSKFRDCIEDELGSFYPGELKLGKKPFQTLYGEFLWKQVVQGLKQKAFDQIEKEKLKQKALLDQIEKQKKDAEKEKVVTDAEEEIPAAQKSNESVQMRPGVRGAGAFFGYDGDKILHDETIAFLVEQFYRLEILSKTGWVCGNKNDNEDTLWEEYQKTLSETNRMRGLCVVVGGLEAICGVALLAHCKDRPAEFDGNLISLSLLTIALAGIFWKIYSCYTHYFKEVSSREKKLILEQLERFKEQMLRLKGVIEVTRERAIEKENNAIPTKEKEATQEENSEIQNENKENSLLGPIIDALENHIQEVSGWLDTAYEKWRVSGPEDRDSPSFPFRPHPR